MRLLLVSPYSKQRGALYQSRQNRASCLSMQMDASCTHAQSWHVGCRGLQLHCRDGTCSQHQLCSHVDASCMCAPPAQRLLQTSSVLAHGWVP